MSNSEARKRMDAPAQDGAEVEALAGRLTADERALIRTAVSSSKRLGADPVIANVERILTTRLAARDVAVAAKVGEQIAQAIEALRVGTGNRYADRRNPSQMRADAAAIARAAALRAEGGA